jgi:hypothetical protein
MRVSSLLGKVVAVGSFLGLVAFPAEIKIITLTAMIPRIRKIDYLPTAITGDSRRGCKNLRTLASDVWVAFSTFFILLFERFEEAGEELHRRAKLAARCKTSKATFEGLKCRENSRKVMKGMLNDSFCDLAKK